MADHLHFLTVNETVVATGSVGLPGAVDWSSPTVTTLRCTVSPLARYHLLLAVHLSGAPGLVLHRTVDVSAGVELSPLVYELLGAGSRVVRAPFCSAGVLRQ